MNLQGIVAHLVKHQLIQASKDLHQPLPHLFQNLLQMYIFMLVWYIYRFNIDVNNGMNNDIEDQTNLLSFVDIVGMTLGWPQSRSWRNEKMRH
jgi:hypothetical protein